MRPPLAALLANVADLTTSAAAAPDARLPWSRLLALAADADADTIAALLPHLAALPGWAGGAPLDWVFAIEEDRHEVFDHSSFETYETVDRHARGVRADPPAALRLCRGLDTRDLATLSPATLRAALLHPSLAHLGGLTVHPPDLDLATLPELAALPLQRLAVEGRRAVDPRLGDALASALAAGPTGLRSLRVHAQDIGPAGAAALAAAPFAATLDELELPCNPIGDEGITALIGAMTGSRAGDGASVHDRASASPLPLRRLDLRECGIGPAGAHAVARLRGLEDLDLAANPIGDEGLVALAGAPADAVPGVPGTRAPGSALATVERLHLADCDLGPAGLAALLAADPPALRELWLHGNRLDDDAVRALVASPLFPRLTALSLFHNPTGPGAEAALAGHPLAAALTGTTRVGDRFPIHASRWPA